MSLYVCNKSQFHFSEFFFVNMFPFYFISSNSLRKWNCKNIGFKQYVFQYWRSIFCLQVLYAIIVLYENNRLSVGLSFIYLKITNLLSFRLFKNVSVDLTNNQHTLSLQIWMRSFVVSDILIFTIIICSLKMYCQFIGCLLRDFKCEKYSFFLRYVWAKIIY